MQFIKSTVSCIVALLLAACGGGSTPQAEQDKHTLSSRKGSATNYQTVVQDLYVAYFGRPADPNGLANFEAALAAADAPTDIAGLAAAYSTNPAVQTLINNFGRSAESQALYGNGTASAFVTAVFRNVLGRAPQSAGLTYWSDAITSGTLSQSDAALGIMAGATTNTTPQGLIDGQLIANRLAVADYFTSQVSNFNATSSYSGASAAASARNMLATVNATTNVTVFQATASSTVASLMSTALVVEQYVGAASGRGNVNGPIATARFNRPDAVVIDSKGNLFVADFGNLVIREISVNGKVTTFAGNMGHQGSANGIGTASSFSGPDKLAIDAGDNIYVGDNGAIRKITPAGVVTTYVGQIGKFGSQNGPAASATLGVVGGMVVDPKGNLYFSDSNHTIRKVDTQGNVSTLVGISGVSGSLDGNATVATFGGPGALAIDGSGNLYTLDGINFTIRKISSAGVVSTIAGATRVLGTTDGQGSAASFYYPIGIAVDAANNIYVSEFAANDIRKVTPTGFVTHFAGGANFLPGYADGVSDVAKFSSPEGLWLDRQGNLYVADSGNQVIRQIMPDSSVTTFAGLPAYESDVDGSGVAARFALPQGLAFGPSGNMYVADWQGATVRKVAPGGVVTTLAGMTSTPGSIDGAAGAARFISPTDVAVDSSENVYVADYEDCTIRKIAPSGMVTTLAGTSGKCGYMDTAEGSPLFSHPSGIVVRGDGVVYVADIANGLIRTITQYGVVSTYQVNFNTSASANALFPGGRFLYPSALTFDASGNLYIVDLEAIRKVDTKGNVTTLAGQGTTSGYLDGPGSSALFDQPSGIAVDSVGNVYVADYGNSVIRMISPSGVVSTVLGVRDAVGFVAGAAPAALVAPRRLAIQGNVLYVTADSGVMAVYNLPAP